MNIFKILLSQTDLSKFCVFLFRLFVGHVLAVI